MAAAGLKKERKHLTLQEKVEVIRKSEAYPKLPLRELGDCFSCGKTQIAGILKAKGKLLALYEENRSDSLQLTRKRARKSELLEVNESLYDWYLLAISKTFIPLDLNSVKKPKKLQSGWERPISKLQTVGLINGKSVIISKVKLWLVSLEM